MDSLSVNVFESLHELLSLFRQRMRESLGTVNSELTFNEMRILMRVGHHPGIRQKDLVEHSNTDKAQMARLLSLLQDKGWLRRTTAESDKRMRCLHLSTEGQRIFAELRDLRERVASELLHDCSPALQAQLLALLEHAKLSARASS